MTFRLTISRLVDSNAVLVLLGTALVVGVVVQLLIPDSMPAAPTAPRIMRSRAIAVLQAAQTPAYPEILSHPLFSAERSAASGASATGGPLSLVGLASAGGRASVVLRASDGSDHVLGAGETLMGWRLAAIGSTSAELQRGAETQVLHVGQGPVSAPAVIVPVTASEAAVAPSPGPGGHLH